MIGETVNNYKVTGLLGGAKPLTRNHALASRASCSGLCMYLEKELAACLERKGYTSAEECRGRLKEL